MGNSGDSSETFWFVVLGIVGLIIVWVFCRRHYRLQNVEDRAAAAIAAYGDDEFEEDDTMRSSMLDSTSHRQSEPDGPDDDNYNYDAYRNCNKYNKNQKKSSTYTEYNESFSQEPSKTEHIVIDALGRAKFIPFDHDASAVANHEDGIINDDAYNSIASLNQYIFMGIRQVSQANAFDWEIDINLKTVAMSSKKDNYNSNNGNNNNIVASLKQNDSNWVFTILNKQLYIKQINQDIYSWVCGNNTILRSSNAQDNQDNSESNNQDSNITQWQINDQLLFSTKDNYNHNYNYWKASINDSSSCHDDDNDDSPFVVQVISKDNYSKWKIIDKGILTIETRVAMIFGTLFASKIKHYLNLT